MMLTALRIRPKVNYALLPRLDEAILCMLSIFSPGSPDCIMSAVEVLKPCVKEDLVLDAVCSTTSLGARAFTVS